MLDRIVWGAFSFLDDDEERVELQFVSGSAAGFDPEASDFRLNELTILGVSLLEP
jgi:hypothetical protein